MDQTEFEKRLWLSSVSLARLDQGNLPIGFASGALVDYAGKHLLLTVWHATRDQGKWAMEVRYDPGKGTQNYTVGSMHFLAKASLGKPRAKLVPVDFAYVEVPTSLHPCRQEIEFPNTIKSEAPITIHTPTFTDLPTCGDNFGFCGLVLPSREEHFGVTYFERHPRIYSGLSFLRTEDDLHYFSLPFPHPGHEQFEGCSGAPILSEKGAFAALLCGGNADANEIYGISIRAQKTPIDILVGNVR